MKKNYKLYGLLCLLAVLILCFVPAKKVSAATEPIIEDKADLFTSEEEERLKEVMRPILEYGGVALVTNPKSNSYSGNASGLAKKYCKEYFGGGSGVVFLIDLYQRRIEIYSTGKLRIYLTNSAANTITDKIYKDATKELYANCAEKAFKMILKLAQGGHVTTPLKYVSNLLIAFCFALIFTFITAFYSRRQSKFGKQVEHVNLLNRDIMSSKTVKIIRKKMVKERKTRHVESSGGSDGSFDSGSSGGSSCDSGGGGGHSF